jgi:hypothetical protein
LDAGASALPGSVQTDVETAQPRTSVPESPARARTKMRKPIKTARPSSVRPRLKVALERAESVIRFVSVTKL